MPERPIIATIRNYLRHVAASGIPVSGAVLYGSYARGDEHPDSDVDLIVLSPKFDLAKTYEDVATLWRLRCSTDARIEPIAAGVREFDSDRGSPILAIAREEGIRVAMQ